MALQGGSAAAVDNNLSGALAWKVYYLGWNGDIQASKYIQSRSLQAYPLQKSTY